MEHETGSGERGSGNGRTRRKPRPADRAGPDGPAHSAALARGRAGRARRPAARQQHLGHRGRPPAGRRISTVAITRSFSRPSPSFPRGSEPSDAVTLAEHLVRKGQEEETGGLAYLAGLARDTPTADNIRAYADIVRERSLLRQLIRVSGEIAASAYENEGRAGARAGRRRRAHGLPDRRKGPTPGHRFRAGARGARCDHRPSRHAARLAGPAHGPRHRLHRTRQDDRGPAARRPRDRRRPPVDGQDDARAEHRGERRDRGKQARRDVLDGNVARAARVPHDFLARPRRPGPHAHRQFRRRGLGAHQQRDRADEDGADVHR